MAGTSNPITDRPILETGQAALAQHLNAIPEGKRGALVISIERSSTWNPSLSIGVAARVNKVMSVAADAKLQKHAKPTTRFYTMFAWVLLMMLLPTPASAQTTYSASLVRVVDGDTYVLDVALGFDVRFIAHVRLADLDTPEMSTAPGKRARDAAEASLKSGRITVQPTGARTFARHVAHVFVDGKKLADILAASGHRK